MAVTVRSLLSACSFPVLPPPRGQLRTTRGRLLSSSQRLVRPRVSNPLPPPFPGGGCGWPFVQPSGPSTHSRSEPTWASAGLCGPGARVLLGPDRGSKNEKEIFVLCSDFHLRSLFSSG